ncbi:CgeB family protein [Paenibacillus koleovorans]|uniref:CgeB family protein n=1 Tax=Paenibacillus koleovorans TaxID=121608 RepID=UPI0013E3D405|nr:glycosyltransferase [Paenibacillus koleovorans]
MKLSRTSSAWQTGWEAGLRLGRDDGRHAGLCESIYASYVRALPDRSWNIRMLYVKADGQPYHSLDQGIEDALRTYVRELHVVGPEEDTVAIAERLRPDLVLVLDAIGRSFSTTKADAMRAQGIRTAVWLPDDPYHSDQTVNIAPHYDYVFTLESSCVELYRGLGCQQVHYLPLAVNPQFMRHCKVEPAYRSDICFVGSAFWNRIALFDELADFFAGHDTKIIGWWWDRLKQYDKLKHCIHGIWLSPEETAKYYSGAKIVINLHRSLDDASHNSNSRQIPANSVNPRMFEIASCATLQLVDERPELGALYTPGTDVVPFTSAADLKSKIEYYLTHEEERREMARKGLFRTIQAHTFRNRVNRLLELIFGS